MVLHYKKCYIYLFFRVHRHMLLVFARGIEPLISDVAGESPNESIGSTTESSDRIIQQLIPSS